MKKICIPLAFLACCLHVNSHSQPWDQYFQSGHNYNSSKYSNNLYLTSPTELLRVNNTDLGFWVNMVDVPSGNSMLSTEFEGVSGWIEMNAIANQNPSTMIGAGSEKNFGSGQISEMAIFTTDASTSTYSALRIHSSTADYGELYDVSAKKGVNHAIGYAGDMPVSVQYDDFLNINFVTEYSLPGYRFYQMEQSHYNPDYTVMFGVNDHGGLATMEMDEVTRQPVGPAYDYDFPGLLNGIYSITACNDGYLVACSYTPPTDAARGILLMRLTVDRWPMWAVHYDFGLAANMNSNEATAAQVLVSDGSSGAIHHVGISIEDGDPSTTSNNNALPALLNVNGSGAVVSVHAFEHGYATGLSRRDAHSALINYATSDVYLEAEAGALDPGNFLIQEPLGNTTYNCTGYNYMPTVNPLSPIVTGHQVLESHVAFTTSPVNLHIQYPSGGVYDCAMGQVGIYKQGEMAGQEASDQFTTTIAPNPATDQLALEFSESASGTFTLVDLFGKVLMQDTFNNAMNQRISMSHLPEGVYMLHVNNNGIQETHKVVKSVQGQ